MTCRLRLSQILDCSRSIPFLRNRFSIPFGLNSKRTLSAPSPWVGCFQREPTKRAVPFLPKKYACVEVWKDSYKLLEMILILESLWFSLHTLHTFGRMEHRHRPMSPQISLCPCSNQFTVLHKQKLTSEPFSQCASWVILVVPIGKPEHQIVIKWHRLSKKTKGG